MCGGVRWALATRRESRAGESFCLVELGSAFTACVAVERGRIVDGLGGTSGPMGWHSGGAWDGEAAYLLSPLRKNDLFGGGAAGVNDAGQGQRHGFREGLLKAVAGLRAVTPFAEMVLSGRLLETEAALAQDVAAALGDLCPVARLDAPRPAPA